jgi:polyhydroxyalkanoate synthesis regulator phasin
MTTALTVRVSTPLTDPKRAKDVLDRVIAINKSVGETYIENGLLLREIMDNGYYREWGYKSFNECIDKLQEQGKIDYGARNARHFIAVADMVKKHKLTAKDIDKVPISKLREIASVKDQARQKQLLLDAPQTSLEDLQKQVRQVKGHTADPLRPVTLLTTETQLTAFNEAIAHARTIWAIEDTVPDVAVLIDSILADWMAGAPTVAQMLNEELHTVQGETIDFSDIPETDFSGGERGKYADKVAEPHIQELNEELDRLLGPDNGPFKIDSPPGPPLTVEETAEKYGVPPEEVEEIKEFAEKYAAGRKTLTNCVYCGSRQGQPHRSHCKTVSKPPAVKVQDPTCMFCGEEKLLNAYGICADCAKA